jgi:hypothetical protein
MGRDMAQAVSHRVVTAEARVRDRGNLWYFWWANGTWTGFSQSSSFFPCKYHSILALHTHISFWGVKNMPVGGRSSEA